VDALLRRAACDEGVPRSAAWRARVRTVVAAGALTASLSPVSAGATGPAAPQGVAVTPSCFGAAARDVLHPCSNPTLRLAVVPTPVQAARDPNSPCAKTTRIGPLNPCAFGVAAAAATKTIALVGDSHASALRPAVDVVARAHGWLGISITHTGCAFSAATKQLPEPARSQCRAWNAAVPSWFSMHPEVDTVFVSAITGSHVTVPAGRTTAQAKVDGYLNAWRRLPPSVKHIVVIRDVPKARGSTLRCVSRAIAARRPAGPACTVPRSRALVTDPEVVAADRFSADRSQAVDLTALMCSPRSCDPVIGGALVHKDIHHLTQTFAATLGPMLLRQFDALAASWPPVGVP
jgi:hypothetical protein